MCKQVDDPSHEGFFSGKILKKGGMNMQGHENGSSIGIAKGVLVTPLIEGVAEPRRGFDGIVKSSSDLAIFDQSPRYFASAEAARRVASLRTRR